MMTKTLTSKHEQLRELILDEIQRLGLKPGDRVPSRPFWRRRLEVSNDTVDRALRGMIEEGVLTARAGSGTFLRRAVPANGSAGETSRRTKVIDVLVPREREQLHESSSPHVLLGRLEGATEACRRLGLGTALQFVNPYRFMTLEELLQAVEPLHDGVLFLNEDLSNRMEGALRGRRVPYAIVSPYRERVNGVGFDLAPAYRAAFAHLKRIGRRNAAYLSNDPSGAHSHLPWVEAAAAEAGAKPPRAYWCVESPRAALERLVAHDLQAYGIDALLCRTDRWALQALDHLTRAGVKVPEDVALIGCDDAPEAAQAGLATVRLPFGGTGAGAVEQLAEMLAEGRCEAAYRRVAAEFVVRGSAQVEGGSDA
ncbi:MAG: substrate-binding domain-containing protein [Planctomycetota bacterium]|nr:substrate-binding domain-containing protein [Planctomycetota bacterium]